jgi:hypothetical protein
VQQSERGRRESEQLRLEGIHTTRASNSTIREIDLERGQLLEELADALVRLHRQQRLAAAHHLRKLFLLLSDGGSRHAATAAAGVERKEEISNNKNNN